MSRYHVFQPSAVLLLAAALIIGSTASDSESLDLLKMISERPWIIGPHNVWNQPAHFDPDLVAAIRQQAFDPQRLGIDPKTFDSKMTQNERDDEDEDGRYNHINDILRMGSEKRSAVATALNAGRRRRQPAPALGKVVTPYVGVGVLNDVGSFFDSLRDNLEVLASLSPEQRATLLHDAPSVVHAPSSGNGGGGGMRRLHALRPLRPTGNIRSYNRRSFVEADGGYPGANHHDPGLLWTGLGRR